MKFFFQECVRVLFRPFLGLSVCSKHRSSFLVCLRGNLRNVYCAHSHLSWYIQPFIYFTLWLRKWNRGRAYSKPPSKAHTKSLRRCPYRQTARRNYWTLIADPTMWEAAGPEKSFKITNLLSCVLSYLFFRQSATKKESYGFAPQLSHYVC